MCVFASTDNRCLLQRLSNKNYDFKESDITRQLDRDFTHFDEQSKTQRLQLLKKPYACYRLWGLRDRDRWDGFGRVDHYSDRQVARGRNCENSGGGITATNCPKFNGTRLCEAHGWEFFDPQCPLLKDHNFKLKYGYLSTIRDIVARKELAYKIRTISKRRIPCATAYAIALRLTWKQASLWWLRTLGKNTVPVREIEHITSVGENNFKNVLYGPLRGDGYRTGGAIQKVEKILRHSDAYTKWEANFIEAFCLEAFKLIRLDFDRPNWYVDALKKNKRVRLVDCEFAVSVEEEGTPACCIRCHTSFDVVHPEILEVNCPFC